MKAKDNRFILKSKESEKKDAALRRQICLCVFLSALVIPLLNDGVLYTLCEYVDGDIALSALNLVLRYIVVILRYLCIFVTYGAVCTGVVLFGYRNFKTPAVLMFAGSFVDYLVARFGSWVYCYEHDLIATNQVTDVLEVGFNYFFLSTFETVKNAVLLIILCRYVKKKLAVKEPLYKIPDDSLRASLSGSGGFLRAAFSNKYPYFKIMLYCAGVHAVYSVFESFFNVTLFQIFADGMPETFSDFAVLAANYWLIAPLCALGLFVSCALCLALSLKKPAPKL